MTTLRHIIILVCFVIFTTTCRDIDSPKNRDKLSRTSLDLESIKSKFKYHDLKEFSIDTISWEKRPDYYQVLDTISYYQIYQDTSKQYSGPSTEDLDQEYYYSIQNSSRGLIELTTLSQMEGEYCDLIYYNIYGSNGKLKTSFPVARRCGDGGYYDEASGKFLNDSIYELLSMDNYKTEDVDAPNILTYSRTITKINKDGSITTSDTTLRTTVEGIGANRGAAASQEDDDGRLTR